MFTTMPVKPKRLDEYVPLVGAETVDALRQQASPLRDARVLHLTLMTHTSRVTDTLMVQVALENSLGLTSRWQVVQLSEPALRLQAQIHRALEGATMEWGLEQRDTWLKMVKMSAQRFDEDFDVVIVHDVHLTTMRALVEEVRGKPCRGRWVWHSHVDLRDAQPEVWATLRTYVEHMDRVVIDMADWRPPDLRLPARVIAPAIDPLSPRNIPVAREMLADVVSRYGIDVERPLIAQMAPLDRAYDPVGAIEVFERVKEEVPEVQMALLACPPHQPEEMARVFEPIAQRSDANPDLHVFLDPGRVGNLEANAFQSTSSVVFQRNIPRGFFLRASEVSWKGKPVVACPKGGIPLQVQDKATGFLASDVDTFVNRLVFLLRQPDEARRMGEAAHRYVREHFLIPRLLGDYLDMYQNHLM